ncbi:Hypothetical protein D9617_1g086470 [Elsinoe fawcettii]|nr:Hypothetical protein D9617_1g086470 [Elsinoe fawcettii]
MAGSQDVKENPFEVAEREATADQEDDDSLYAASTKDGRPRTREPSKDATAPGPSAATNAHDNVKSSETLSIPGTVESTTHTDQGPSAATTRAAHHLPPSMHNTSNGTPGYKPLPNPPSSAPPFIPAPAWANRPPSSTTQDPPNSLDVLITPHLVHEFFSPSPPTAPALPPRPQGSTAPSQHYTYLRTHLNNLGYSATPTAPQPFRPPASDPSPFDEARGQGAGLPWRTPQTPSYAREVAHLDPALPGRNPYKPHPGSRPEVAREGSREERSWLGRLKKGGGSRERASGVQGAEGVAGSRGDDEEGSGDEQDEFEQYQREVMAAKRGIVMPPSSGSAGGAGTGMAGGSSRGDRQGGAVGSGESNYRNKADALELDDELEEYRRDVARSRQPEPQKKPKGKGWFGRKGKEKDEVAEKVAATRVPTTAKNVRWG